MAINYRFHFQWFAVVFIAFLLLIMVGMQYNYNAIHHSLTTNAIKSGRHNHRNKAGPQAPQVFQIKSKFPNNTVFLHAAKRGNGQNREALHRNPYSYKYTLKGRIFKGGASYGTFVTQITTSVVHVFPKDLVKSKFDENFFQSARLMSPGMAVCPDGGIILALRVNVSPSPHLHHSTMLKNYLYVQNLDSKYQPLSEGRLINIPSPTVNDNGIQYGGPADPRVFIVQNKTLVLYNRVEGSASACRDGKHYVIRQYLYDVEKDKSTSLSIRGMPRSCWEKNWSLLSFVNKLSFIYSIDPLLITECSEAGVCHFKPSDGGEFYDNRTDHIHNPGLPGIRGGTPFIEYRWPYAIAVGHTTSVCKRQNRVYNLYFAHLLVYRIDKKSLVYVSEPIKMHPHFLSRSQPPSPVIATSYIYPVSLILKDENTVHVGAHINDMESFVFQISGLEAAMRTISKQGLNSVASQGTVNAYVNEMRLCDFQLHV